MFDEDLHRELGDKNAAVHQMCANPWRQAARSTKFCRWRLMFVGTQYGAWFVSHLWHLKFGSGLSIFGKFMAYIISKLNVSTGNWLQTYQRSVVFPTSGQADYPSP